MNQAERLERMRDLAEQSRPLKLKEFDGCLLLLGRVDVRAAHIANVVVVDFPPRQVGLTILRFSRVIDALMMSLTGWIVVRIADGHVVAPLAGDYDTASRCAASLGLTKASA